MRPRRLIKVVWRVGFGLLLVGPASYPAGAQTAATGPTAQDEVIDVALGALEEPVVPFKLLPPERQYGAPVWPPYKQEPPDAQLDFRSLVSPTTLPPSVTPPAGSGAPSPGPAPSPPKPCPKPKPCPP